MTIYHYEHLKQRLEEIKPIFRFSADWLHSPESWHKSWEYKFQELLGPWPPECDPKAQWELLTQRDKYSLYKAVYATEPGLETFAYVAIPHDIATEVPGVLCLHGHGKLGVHPVVNYGDQPELSNEVKRHNYDFGACLAEGGVIVFAPNLRGFGDRLTKREKAANRDPCNVNFFQQMLFGEVAVASQLHDLKVALDLLSGIPEVNANSIGCAGLSYGGRLTTFLSAIDHRIKAAVVAGCLNSFAERIRSYGSCAFQVVPGLLKYADTAEILGLIVPRPLALELGELDGCCPQNSAKGEFERLQLIYQAFDCEDKLKLFEHKGGHIFHGGKSIPWLIKQLRTFCCI